METTPSSYLLFKLQKTVAEQNLEDTRQQLLAARNSHTKAVDLLETRVLALLPIFAMMCKTWLDGGLAKKLLGQSIFIPKNYVC